MGVRKRGQKVKLLVEPKQTVNEVAIVMSTEDELTSKHERYVTFNYKATAEKSVVQCIPDYHRSYDPLQYPLVYPDSQDGCHYDLDHTCLQHLNFQLMERDGITNPILRGRSLGQ